MVLTTRSLKVTALLDPKQVAALPEPPGGKVTLTVACGDRTFTAPVTFKALRKVREAIAANGADGVAVILQGKLESGNVIAEAGLTAQVKASAAVPARLSQEQTEAVT
jgi:hypothetical protein